MPQSLTPPKIVDSEVAFLQLLKVLYERPQPKSLPPTFASHTVFTGDVYKILVSAVKEFLVTEIKSSTSSIPTYTFKSAMVSTLLKQDITCDISMGIINIINKQGKRICAFLPSQD